VTTHVSHSLRADASDNRDRILEAARELFAAEGLGVPMRVVARRAGVGPATLYRHFSTKELLATAAFVDELRACHVVVEEGLADPDPWHGFCHVIERLFELHAINRAFTAAFTTTFPGAVDLAADRRAALSSLDVLTRRAKDSGDLRHDFVLDDLILVLMANRGLNATSPAARIAASRRFAALAIQAFRAS
jgi:AcrR family transcriptional regulator